MWAFAILDRRKNLVFCSRDRFGVKPFYFSEVAGGFAFGSEIRQLLPLLHPVAAATRMLAGFLISRVAERDDSTFFSKVRKLPGGHNLVLELGTGRYTINRFYRLEQRLELASVSSDDAVREFRALLEDAVRLRLRSDVRVGTCLSGGLDSSSIATLAARQYSSAADVAFSAITAISEDPITDESQFAKGIVDASHLDWIRLRPSYEDFRESLDEAVEAQEEPFAAASVIMQFFVMRAARRAGIPVLLDGQGGDEALLGYERYYADYCLQLAKAGRFGACAGFLGGLLANGRKGTMRSLMWNLAYFHADYLRSLSGASHRVFKADLESASRDDMASRRRYSDLFSLQRLEIESTNLPVLLRYEDKNSMWHSIETRLPFLDYRLVEFALSIDAAIKLKYGWSKFVLRKAMEQEMPAQIVWRNNKFGFEAPESRWMGAHASAAKAAIQSSDLLSAVCEKETLSDAGIQRLKPGLRWRLLSVALWERAFGIGALA
jgi:asparagine synthase (glutamine-hydrolysing)